jgi:hypothetical protein
MVIHYPPARLRRNSDQPTAITDVPVATSGSSYGTGEIPLGTTTCSARSRQGIWALYPNGDQVVVVWPGGTVAGPPAEVAGELDRLEDGRDGTVASGDHSTGILHQRTGTPSAMPRIDRFEHF